MRLVAKLQKITNLASLILLFLEGDALVPDLEINEEDQKNTDLIEQKLMSAFMECPSGAHGKLVEINNMRRLAVERDLERIVKLAFVIEFLSDMSTALQRLPGIESIKMSDFLLSARVLAVNRAHDLDVV